MEESKKKNYPFILIKKAAFFPTEKIPLVIEGEDVIQTVNKAIKDDGMLVAAFQSDGDMSNVGVLSKILQSWVLAPAMMGVIVEGKERIKIMEVHKTEEAEEAEVGELKINEGTSTELEAFLRSIFDQFQNLSLLSGKPLFFLEEIKNNNVSSENLSFLIASALNFNLKEKIELLETLDMSKRLKILNLKLAKEIDILKIEKKIRDEVDREVGKTQKDYILRERMHAIEKELGISEEYKEYENLEKSIKNAGMPQETEKVALKELKRLKSLPAASAEISYIRTYLDWLSELPWSTKDEAAINLKKAEKILNEDHYGLQKVKERILEYLAVQKLTNGHGSATIMCFAGPPGTGKTSVGKSIARALNRKFYRLSLGGIRDEAEIRGHRRTYIGALPGRIIQGIKIAGTKNPVFMLDEIDKVGADFRGDPSAALLEVLDPEQNNSFSDHYLEVPFDLSEVIFITTANMLDSIPPTLRDRMEVIEFSGYAHEEKFNIAKEFLLPRVFTSHGLAGKDLKIQDKAIKKIINKYTREAGVRHLERKLSEIARKVAKNIAENGNGKKFVINESNLADYLGPEEFQIVMREAKDEVGISTGMAWTPAGGEIIFIEALFMPGKGNFMLTGQLGKTMKESAKAALSYVRSKSRELHFNPYFYNKSDIHIHVPAGAIPKDGPSAGIAIASSLASILTGRKIKKEIALTGEITLSGKVLEVSGIKEKILAAYRSGVEIVILPESNKKNISDVPEEIREKLSFKFVSHMDEVLKLVLK